MFYKTKQECIELSRSLGFDVDTLKKNESYSYSTKNSIRALLEQPRPATAALAKQIVAWLGEYGSCLLWVTEHGIWPSSENLHLYYKLRTAYDDMREIGQAPGHYFLGHESRDLITFLDLSIQFGWGAHLLAAPAFTYVFISHDGWLRVESESEMEKIVKDIESMSLRYETA